ncbi:retrotransposon-like protein 1 [Bombina bombina]|uniref:retrotransposon-like protein 1 n=1 Tax=Bombina bombina TaxID=8345 RepID=UPI00235AD28A|nr:retrotransposon-like protein 1 [Bombina bombina]
MPFGLTNAPATFQFFINNIFRDLLDTCVVVYLDDILIYSATLEEHIKYVSWVLSRLQIHRLYAKAEKCQFHTQEISFRGYFISPHGIQMQQDKVETVTQWPEPRNRKQLQRFLGFSNYYRKFIKNYSTIAKPLTKLPSSNSPFRWNPQANDAFQFLKSSFTIAPISLLP